MKQPISILGILSFLLLGMWGCTENPEKPKQSKQEIVGTAETTEKDAASIVETTQSGMGNVSDVVNEKAKKVIEELKVTPSGSTEETKESE